MKKLVLLIAVQLFVFTAISQICTIDYSFTSPGIYPDTLPIGTVGEFYDEDITFVLPTDTLGISFTNFEIIDVAVPPGMDWQCSNEANGCNYDPQDDPYGCARAYGTPTVPGQYTIEISVIADLTLQSGNQTSFFVFMEVLPPIQDNEGFGMSPGMGCAPLTVEFTNNLPSTNYTPIADFTEGYKYSWDFGNGNQSNTENPNPQTYHDAGEYHVDYTAVIDTFGFFLSNVTVNSVSCTDVSWLYGNVDLYLELWDADDELVYTTESNPNDSDLPTSWSMNVKLDNPPYKLMVWDWDDDQLTGQAPDNCVDGDEDSDEGIFLVMPAVNAYGNTSNFGNNGGLNLTYVINKPTITVNVVDTVTVFPVPEVPIIDADDQGITIDLSTEDLGYDYQWFNNGQPIADAATESFSGTESGVFTVVATNEYGCSAESLPYTYNSTVSINEIEGTPFKLYPNPVSDQLIVALQSASVEHIEVLDMTGRTVMEKSGSFSGNVILDMSDKRTGYYLVRVSSANGTWTNKIMKD